MPSKRSRSKEREKKQNAREKRSKEQVEKDREASRRSMKLLRESRDEGHALEENKIEDKDWYANYGMGKSYNEGKTSEAKPR